MSLEKMTYDAATGERHLPLEDARQPQAQFPGDERCAVAGAIVPAHPGSLRTLGALRRLVFQSGAGRAGKESSPTRRGCAHLRLERGAGERFCGSRQGRLGATSARSAKDRCGSSRLNRRARDHPAHPRAPGALGAGTRRARSARAGPRVAGQRRHRAYPPRSPRHRVALRLRYAGS